MYGNGRRRGRQKTEPVPVALGQPHFCGGAARECARHRRLTRSWPFGHLRPSGYRRRFC